ncbi:MAG TPA: acyl-CoA dehydrogenase family protein [Stellaceae bacterium]|nr:acyl-CoA dehydrogenase family protein [Stellaceae bacterium]
MDFDLSDEQRLLKDQVTGLIEKEYSFEQRKDYAREPLGYSEARWAQFAELGLLALPFAEAQGGIGGTPVETMIVMEAFGRGLVLEPYLATVVLGGGLLRFAGSDAQREEMVPAIAGGTLRLAFAHTERQSRYDVADVAVAAKPSPGGGFVLSGHKGVVLHGEGADRLIVSARTAGSPREREGISLFLVDPTADGVSVRGYKTVDGLRAAEITLGDVKIGPDALLGPRDHALPLIERAVDLAIAALVAEAVGAMSVMHELTIEYLKTRKQFGVAIGAFQALQHRAVDMLVALEQARSMAMLAAMMAEAPDAAERRRTIAAAKVQCGRSGRYVGQQAIQLHGGIGMTDEYKVGHYFKRVTMIDTLFGDADHHLAAVADAGGLIEAI